MAVAGASCRRPTGDLPPGGGAVHGLLAEEVAEIVALFHQWGEVDRSHRKLAHRGSYLERVWVSPSSVRRVLAAEGLRLRPLPRPARSVRQPFPDWVTYQPGMLWIFDTTHFTRAGVAVCAIEDLVSRKWLTEVVSVEETSVQVQAAFCQALEAEGSSTRSPPAWTAPSTWPAMTPAGRSCWPSATTARR